MLRYRVFVTTIIVSVLLLIGANAGLNFSNLSLPPLLHVYANPFEVDVTCSVYRVVDGDTFDCFPVGRVRLADIDAPELGTAEGNAAKDALTTLILNKKVYLDVDDIYVMDKYNRVVAVAYIRYNSTHLLNVNKWLTDNGYAVISDYYNEFSPYTWRLYEYYPQWMETQQATTTIVTVTMPTTITATYTTTQTIVVPTTVTTTYITTTTIPTTYTTTIRVYETATTTRYETVIQTITVTRTTTATTAYTTTFTAKVTETKTVTITTTSYTPTTVVSTTTLTTATTVPKTITTTVFTTTTETTTSPTQKQLQQHLKQQKL